MKRNDVILVFVVLMVALVLLAFAKSKNVDGEQIAIHIAGELYAIKDLRNNEIIEIKNVKGEVINVIVVDSGQAYMKEASCPDVLCIKQGRIHMTKEMIVCLPNKVTVKVVGEDGEQIDVIVR